MRRTGALTAVLSAVLLFVSAVPAGAVPASVVCSESVDPASCDSDRDRITDVLEKQICGTSTCATGREDADRDGIPDWSEFIVCGDARCANTSKDTDSDGIPDFAENVWEKRADFAAGGYDDCVNESVVAPGVGSNGQA